MEITTYLREWPFTSRPDIWTISKICSHNYESPVVWLLPVSHVCRKMPRPQVTPPNRWTRPKMTPHTGFSSQSRLITQKRKTEHSFRRVKTKTTNSENNAFSMTSVCEKELVSRYKICQISTFSKSTLHTGCADKDGPVFKLNRGQQCGMAQTVPGMEPSKKCLNMLEKCQCARGRCCSCGVEMFGSVLTAVAHDLRHR